MNDDDQDERPGWRGGEPVGADVDALLASRFWPTEKTNRLFEQPDQEEDQ